MSDEKAEERTAVGTLDPPECWYCDLPMEPLSPTVYLWVCPCCGSEKAANRAWTCDNRMRTCQHQTVDTEP